MQTELTWLGSFLEALQVIRELSSRSQDILMSTGERFSAYLLTAVLRDRNVVATFCLVGGPARSNPDLVKAIVADGHVLCNHTVDHDMGLRHKSDGEITSDLEDTQAAILAAAPDADIRFFRAPGGNFATNLNSTAATLGFTPLGWSIDTRDWQKPGAAAIRDTVLTQIHPGAVVLMHDGGGDRSQTVSALPEIIDGLAELGYSFVVPST